MLFISWTPVSRAMELSLRLRAEYVIPVPAAIRLVWPVRYMAQAIATIFAIVRRRPGVVLFTNPPFLSGIACLIGARLVGAKCWADCHSGAYNDPRWSRFARANRAVTSRCDGAIFHTARLAEARRQEVRRSVVVSLFWMAGRQSEQLSSLQAEVSSSTAEAVVVCSYGFDEPILELFAAAKMEPSVKMTFTGRPPRQILERAPAEVEFAGWLPDLEYHRLIDASDVVLCMTTREDTMQNGLVEGLQHARPVITSDTLALGEWSRDVPGVILVKPTGEAIASALRQVSHDRARWRAEAQQGKVVAQARARAELDELIGALAGEGTS